MFLIKSAVAETTSWRLRGVVVRWLYSSCALMPADTTPILPQNCSMGCVGIGLNLNAVPAVGVLGANYNYLVRQKR